MIQYKTNGAFETFTLDPEFLKGFADTTGLGQIPKDIIQNVVSQAQAQQGQGQSGQSGQGNQQGQGGAQGQQGAQNQAGQNGQGQGQQGQGAQGQGQQGQGAQGSGNQGGQGSQQGNQQGQGAQGQGQQGQGSGNQSGQGGAGGQGQGQGAGRQGTQNGQGSSSDLAGSPSNGNQAPAMGGFAPNTFGGGSNGGSGGLGGSGSGSGGLGGLGGTPGSGNGQGGFGGHGQGGSGNGNVAPMRGFNPWELAGSAMGGKNTDPYNKGASAEGFGRREPFDADAARLGAEAIYNGKSYIKDVDDSSKISKDQKRAIEDYKQTLQTVKSTLAAQSKRLLNTYDMGVAGHIERVFAPKVDWRMLLERFVSRGSEPIMTYSRPDRRFVGANQVLPGPKFTDNMIKDMVIGIDSSSSMTDAELAVAMGHIWNIYKRYKVKAELAFWDTKCSGGIELKKKTDVTHIPSSPHHGGTDVDCFFSWLNTRMTQGTATGKNRKLHPSVVIIFTDGYFCGPPRLLPRCGIDKVIWVLTTAKAFYDFSIDGEGNILRGSKKAPLDFNSLE